MGRWRRVLFLPSAGIFRLRSEIATSGETRQSTGPRPLTPTGVNRCHRIEVHAILRPSSTQPSCMTRTHTIATLPRYRHLLVCRVHLSRRRTGRNGGEIVDNVLKGHVHKVVFLQLRSTPALRRFPLHALADEILATVGQNVRYGYGPAQHTHVHYRSARRCAQLLTFSFSQCGRGR